MAEGKIYVSKVDGFADYEGQQVPLRSGVTRVREGHPLLKGRESLFEEIHVHYDVESARQAPAPESKPEPKAAAAKAEAAEAKGDAEDTKPAAPAKASAPRRGPRKASGAGS